MSKGQLQILLVDDDEDEFILLRNLISHPSFSHPYDHSHLDWAASFDAALRMFETNSHDVYLVDYHLGRQNGLDLVAELIRRGKKAVVIILTGFANYEIDTAAMRAGADDFLVKDQLTPQMLERSIRYAIEHKQIKADLDQRVLARTFELEESNRRLREEILARQRIQGELHRAKEELEMRVTERTAELSRAATQAQQIAGELSIVLNSMSELLIQFDAHGILIRANPVALKIFGFDPLGMDGKRLIQALAIRDLEGKPLKPKELPSFRALKGETVGGELLRFKNRNGEDFTVMASAAPVLETTGHLQGVVATWYDVSERQRLYEEVRRLAVTDSLTGRYNRRGFFQFGERAMDEFQRYSHPLSVIMFDIDLFKDINDTYGHAAGDRVLQEVVGRCCGDIRLVDLFGRLGGDEFAILMPETDVFRASEIAQRLLIKMTSEPVQIDEGKIVFSISIGVAMAQKDTRSLEDLLKRADRALYAAKEKGRNRIEVGK